MEAEGKRRSRQEAIDRALEEMGCDRMADGFDPKEVNLSEFCRKTHLSRSKARTLQKKSFRDVHGRTGAKAASTVMTGYEGILDNLIRKGVTNSSACLDRLREAGYAGGVTAVKEHILLASILFSPFPPMYLRRSRHRSFADPANADAQLPASLAPPSRRLRRATRPSGGTTARLSL